jgi:hypothetical protein
MSGELTAEQAEELRRLEADIRRRTLAGIDPSPSEGRALLTALDAARAQVTAAYALGLEALGILSPAGDSCEGLVAAAKRVVAERDAARAEVARERHRAEVAEAKIELGRAFSAHARACNDANRCGDKASHDRAMATKQRLADARSRLKALGAEVGR